MAPDRRSLPLLFAVALVAAVGSWLVPAPVASQGVESEAGAGSSESPEPTTSDPEPVWVGVQVGEADGEASGAPVRKVIEESPASRAGIEDDDRILTVDGETVSDLDSLRSALSAFGPGDNVDLTIRRGDDKQTVQVTLSTRPSQSDVMRRQLVGSSLPDLKLENLSGESIDPADYRGKPLILEFWATWCAPCRATQKTLGTIEDTFGDRVEILGVSPEKREALRTYREKVDLPFTIVRDPDESTHEQLMVSQYPTLVVVDPEGTITDVFVGTDHREALTRTLEALVD